MTSCPCKLARGHEPAGFTLRNIAAKGNLEMNQICMVGDRLDTDILFGKNAGLTTSLVLSGVTDEETLFTPSSSSARRSTSNANTSPFDSSCPTIIKSCSPRAMRRAPLPRSCPRRHPGNPARDRGSLTDFWTRASCTATPSRAGSSAGYDTPRR